jgi:hypothetical protein
MPSLPNFSSTPAADTFELGGAAASCITFTSVATAIADDALTETEIDAMFVAEMERRDREAARPAGYRNAACEACGTALFVPVGQAGDVLCPQCQRDGEALAAAECAIADGDDDPRPPAGGALHPDSGVRGDCGTDAGRRTVRSYRRRGRGDGEDPP